MYFLVYQVQELIKEHHVNYVKWLSLLHRGYSVVCYGLGSKKTILQDFHDKHLMEKDCVVVNGLFPSLTLKDILCSITEDILDNGGSFSTTDVHLEEIFSCLTEDLYLLISNIDGHTLRSRKVQSSLASLASHPMVHLVCTFDHINTPLLWDQELVSKFNFICFDCTTFLPYTEETGGADSLMVRKTGQWESLTSVWESLTPNAKHIYLILAK